MSANQMTERGRIESALSHIPAHDRDLWIKIGMAIKSELSDDEGFATWSEWSQQDESYKENDALAVWRGIDSSGGINIGSLFHEAKAHGWTPQGEAVILSAEEIAQRKEERAKAEATHQVGEAKKRAAAIEKAAAIWQAAAPAGEDHHYLVCKQVAPVDTLREIDAGAAAAILGYVPKSSGEALTGRVLVAPVEISGLTTTCELIDGDGRKSAIYGGAKAGGYWAAQALPDGDGAGLTLFIGEGVATMLTVREAGAGWPSVAALSSGNLLAVAKSMRKRYPAAVLALVADLVKATGEPDRHAVEAAQAVGGLMIAPDLGGERAERETDFNDMAARFGLDAVRIRIKAALNGFEA